MLNGNEKRVVDIEQVISENRYIKIKINISISLLLFRYLKEKMNELIQEKNHAVTNATKYKVSLTFFFIQNIGLIFRIFYKLIDQRIIA
jgi:hypothetical protein